MRTLPAYDTRTARAGGIIGFRHTHTPLADQARTFLTAARTARLLGDRALAAEYLATAGRVRARWAARITPAPTGAGFWSPMLGEWINLPA